jgi:peptidoglycan/LPS O-acetylase OafA/YrhL
VAISLVLLDHGGESLARSWPALSFVHANEFKVLGLLGVQIFFGLSGLLITSRLIGEELRHDRIDLRAFYVRRFFRILPAASFFLCVVGALSLGGVLHVSLGRWLASLLFSANYAWAERSWYVGHFWSLAVEEHFYFVWPALFLVLGRVTRRTFTAVALAFLLALWRAMDFKFQITGSSAEVFWGRTDIVGDGLLWGVVMALVLGEARWGEKLTRTMSKPGVWFFVVALVLVSVWFPAADWKPRFLLLTVKALAIPLMIVGTLSRPEGAMGRFLELAPLRWLGRLSYSCYLWQQLFLVFDEFLEPKLGFLQHAPWNFAAVLVCAALSHYLLEKPLIELGHRLSKRQKRVAPATAGAV